MVNIPKNIERAIFSGSDPVAMQERFHKEIISQLPLGQQIGIYRDRIAAAINESDMGRSVASLMEETRYAIYGVL